MFCPKCAAPCKEHIVPDWGIVQVCDPCTMVYEVTEMALFMFPFKEILWDNMPAETRPDAVPAAKPESFDLFEEEQK